MPIFGKPIKDRVNQLKPHYIDRIRAGNVVPVISNEALLDLVLGSYSALKDRYAEFIEYPLPEPYGLREMVKFRSIAGDKDDWELKHEYLNLVKSHVYYYAQENGLDEDMLAEAEVQVDQLDATAFAQLLGYPDFSAADKDPLMILANMPLPVYITTSPFNFLEVALNAAGKKPRTELCRWRSSLDSEPSVFEDGTYLPSKDEPLVYHLFGVDTRPDSLVLTEDDLLQFLVAAAQGQGKDADRIPSRVRQAVLDSALVLLGFNVTGRIFRTLFWGLLRQAGSDDKGIFTVQAPAEKVVKEYLKGYLKEAQFEVFWGDLHAYTQELQPMLKG